MLFSLINSTIALATTDLIYIEETIVGNTISQVLELTQYYPNDLLRSMKEQINDAIKSDKLKPNEGMRLLAEYENGLTDHTYLTFSNGPVPT